MGREGGRGVLGPDSLNTVFESMAKIPPLKNLWEEFNKSNSNI